MQVVVDFDEGRPDSRVWILRRDGIFLLGFAVVLLSSAAAYFGAFQLARAWVADGDGRVAAFALEAARQKDLQKQQQWNEQVGGLQEDIADFNARLIALNQRGAVIAGKMGLEGEGEEMFAFDSELLCAADEEPAEAEAGEGDGENENENDTAKISAANKTIARQARALEHLETKYALLADQTARRAVLRDTIPMVRPVLGKNWLASRYGYRRDPFTGRRAFHAGYDYAARTGTPVVAGADGVVVYVGRLGNYGKAIEIYHGGGVSSLYAHLSEYKVGRWQYVRVGQLIGEVGSTGRSTGPHLHYEVRINNRPRPVQKAVKELRQARRVG